MRSFFIPSRIDFTKQKDKPKGYEKMIESKTNEYDVAIRPIARVFPALCSVPQSIKLVAEEIRIKCGTPLIIRSGDQNHVIQATADSALINECISAICQNSVHTYEKDIANGFITLYGGHRAGICGSAVYNDDGLHAIKNISSVNIRIARQHCGSAKDLLTLFDDNNASKGLLIIGRPLSGKTTVLRDLCRSIGGRFRISLIDERHEIAAVYDGKPCLDVGLMTDVFSGYGKSDGIIRAIRCMSPDYIVTDELGVDAESIRQLINSGVGLIMTAHADSIETALANEGIKAIVDSGAIQHIALLRNHRITAVKQIITPEVMAECTL